MTSKEAMTKKEVLVEVAPAWESMCDLVYQTKISLDLIEGLIEALDSVMIDGEDFPIGLAPEEEAVKKVCRLEREISMATENVTCVNVNLAAIMEKLRI